MKILLSYSQITDQFDSEWVLLDNPETAPDLAGTSGTVIWHSKDRDEVYRKARELRPRHAAVLYVGKLPQDMAVVL